MKLFHMARVGKQDDKHPRTRNKHVMHYARSFIIDVTFHAADGKDPEGYVAECEPLGLAIEATSLDGISRKVAETAPELFDLNIRPTLHADIADLPPRFQLRVLVPA
jgi:hypothetical protein